MDYIKKYFTTITWGSLGTLVLAGWNSYKDRNRGLGIEKSFISQLASELILYFFIFCFFIAVIMFFRTLWNKKHFSKITLVCSICFILTIKNFFHESYPIIKGTWESDRQKELITKLNELDKFFVELEKVKPSKNSSDFIVRVVDKNNFLISGETVLKMAIVPFEGNKIIESKVSWVESKPLKVNREWWFNFGAIKATSEVNFLVSFLKNDKATNGFLYDIYYTWDSGDHWAFLRENLNNVNVEQTRNIQSFIGNMKSENLK